MALQSKTGNIVLSSIGIIVGCLILFQNFLDPSPPAETGNRSFDEGAAVGQWTFIASGFAILGYSIFSLIAATKKNSDDTKK